MHFSIRLAVAAGLVLAASAVLAQDNAVVLLDATHKTNVCMVADVTRTVDNPLGCVSQGNHLLPFFLVQGQRNQLRVIHRKFLTNYSFFVDNITPVQNFAIEDLNEAANLTTPFSSAGTTGVSKGAVPKGLATSGALALRSAQDVLAELLNPATASNPATEFASDWVVIKREAENVRNDADALQAVWNNLQRGPDDPANPCLSAFGSPTVISAGACLHVLNRDERTGVFGSAAAPYSDEDAFRKLIVKDNDAIAMVTLLGNTLSQQTSLFTNQFSALDGDLSSLRADMNTLAGNAQAVQDAVDLLGSITKEMKKAQIKAKIIQTLNGGSKPVLDDTELNLLTNEYYAFTQSEAGQKPLDTAKFAINHLWSRAIEETRQAFGFAPTVCASEAHGKGARLGCFADEIDTTYSPILEQAHTNLYHDLPTQVAEVNIQQSRLLARANEIYDNSELIIPLDKAIDLSGNSGNLRVYFTIYETETFPRFSIPSSSSSTGSVVAATPATIATPPATSSTTTTAAATTTTTTTAVQPSGTPVTSGVLEVHDRYRATMVAAFAFSPNLKELSIQTSPITTGMATGSTTANPIACTTAAPCTQVTVSGPAHSSVILGMSFHLWGYDTFPGAYTWKRPREALKQGFGFFGGLSVQNLNDYYAGVDFQIAHGVQIMGGVNLFRQNTLAPGFTNGGIYPGTPVFTGTQQWTHGAYFGLGLNLSIFRKAFGSVTGLGTTAATGGS